MLFGCFPEKTFSIQRKTRGRHTAEDGQNIDHDVYVLIPLESDWEAFLQNNLGSKTRYNARNALRQVEKTPNSASPSPTATPSTAIWKNSSSSGMPDGRPITRAMPTTSSTAPAP